MGIFSSLIKFFEGRVGVSVDAKNKNVFLTFLVGKGINAKVVPYGDGGIYTEISPRILKNIAPSLDKLNIMVYINNIYGFKRLSSRYSGRYGLWLGALLFAALLWVSTLFVWRVDIVGAEELSREETRAELSKMGVSVGALISDIDRTAAINAFLTEHAEISWAALNFKGTTAVLVLRETEERPNEDVGEETRLLVAAEDGVICSVLVYEGTALIKVGTPVKKGDLLVSGLISGSGLQITETPILKMSNAVASVKADVTRTAEVFVPFCEQITEYESGEKSAKTVSVFGRDFSFGKTEGLTLEDERHVTFFGAIEIPVTVRTYREKNEKTVNVTRESEQARLTAEELIYKKIGETVGDGELSSVKTYFAETEEGWLARAEIGCTVEIAVPYEGAVNPRG